VMMSKGTKTAADAARLFNVHPATVSRLLASTNAGTVRVKAYALMPSTSSIARSGPTGSFSFKAAGTGLKSIAFETIKKQRTPLALVLISTVRPFKPTARNAQSTARRGHGAGVGAVRLKIACGVGRWRLIQIFRKADSYGR
jgi:hypothetical protein